MERAGVDVAEYQIGVGDGRFRAAATVTGGTRFRAGTRWPDLEQPSGGDPRNGPTTGADRMDVEDGRGDPVVTDDALGRDAGHPIPDERDVERRAAHVHRDDVPETVRGPVEDTGAWRSRRA